MPKKYFVVVFLLALTGAMVIYAKSDSICKSSNRDLPTARLFINGREIKPDVPPVIIDNRVMVPIRAVSEALGAQVTWDTEKRAVYINNDTKPALTLPEKKPEERSTVPAIEMLYQLKTDSNMVNTGQRFSGVKIGSGRKYRLSLPDWGTIQISNDRWSYIDAYIGIDFTWYDARGNPYVNTVEAGVSINGDEFHDPVRRGWYPFFNYYPRHPEPPFNDPSPLRVDAPISGNECTLELQVGELEVIEGYYRWQVHFYVNGQEVFVGPIYTYGSGRRDDPNLFDAKVAVGCYMDSGDENEINFGPCRIEYFQVARADNKDFPLEATWLPLKPKNLSKGEAGVSMGEVVNQSTNRHFEVKIDDKHWFFEVSLPPAI